LVFFARFSKLQEQFPQVLLLGRRALANNVSRLTVVEIRHIGGCRWMVMLGVLMMFVEEERKEVYVPL